MKKQNDKEHRFERLVHEQRSVIYSVCYLFSADRDGAADLFQEVLLHLWQGFDRTERNCTERAWVYRVAMNCCIDQHRRSRHKVETMPLRIDQDFYDSEEQNPAAERLHRRIAKLPPFDRALVLLWLDDLPYDEIAAVVGISANNVGVRLQRIKEKLKQITD